MEHPGTAIRVSTSYGFDCQHLYVWTNSSDTLTTQTRQAMCVQAMSHWCVFASPLFPWKCNKQYILRVCVCILALVNRQANRIFSAQYYTVTGYVACLPLSYSSILSHQWHFLRKNVTKHKMHVLMFSTTFSRNICHSNKNWARYYHKCTYVFI
jgi:hypothetical protein